MRGYVVQKGGRFYAVIYEGVDPLTGRERRRWHPAGESRQEAELLAARLAAAASAIVRQPGPTLATYLLRQWLPAKEMSLRPSTWDGYRRLIELHVVPRLGSVSLRRLRAEQLEALYAELLLTGRRNGQADWIRRPCSKSTSFCAKRWPMLATVAWSSATSPRTPKLPNDTGRTRHYGPGTQSNCRLSWRSPGASVCSLRIGWRRLPACDAPSFSACAGAISTWTRDGSRSAGRSSRWATYSMTPRARPAPLVVRSTWTPSPSKSCAPGEHVERTSPILLSEMTTMSSPHRAASRSTQTTSPSPSTGSWRRPAYPDYACTICRHTHASLLLKERVPIKVVSERLGHATPGFTMATYQHVLPGMQADAARVFAGLITVGLITVKPRYACSIVAPVPLFH